MRESIEEGPLVRKNKLLAQLFKDFLDVENIKNTG